MKITWELKPDPERKNLPNLICEMECGPKEANWDRENSSEYVGRIFSMEALFKIEGLSIAEAVGLDLPSNKDPEPNEFLPGKFQDEKYGWKKMCPRITKPEFGNLKIIKVFQYGLWPVDILHGERL